jgi:hypothetical protein
MNTEFIYHQHHSWIGAPPQDGLVFVKPGENALAVCLPKSFGAQVLSRTQQSRCCSTLVPRVCGAGERLVGLYPRKGRSEGTWQNDEVANELNKVNEVCAGFKCFKRL